MVISLLMLTVREPLRKDLHRREGQHQVSISGKRYSSFLNIPKHILAICIGTAFTAFINYGMSAWMPTYLSRTFGWSISRAGLSYGLVLCAGAVSGVLWGGWYADKLKARVCPMVVFAWVLLQALPVFAVHSSLYK
jgi:sugar phosphate permease